MLDRAVWESSAIGLAVWQAAIGAYVSIDSPSAPLIAAQAVLLVGGVLLGTVAAGSRLAVRVAFFVGLEIVLAADLAASVDRPPVFAAVCASILVLATIPLVMDARVGVPLVAVGAVGSAATVHAAGMGAGAVAAVSIPVMLYCGAAALVRSLLLRRCAEADVAISDRLEALARLRRTRTEATTAAEHARLLHDTVINTLGAIASGGGATRDPDLVRRRCEADLERLRAPMRAQRATSLDWWATVGDGLGLEIVWAGVDEDGRREATTRIDPSRRSALVGAVRELLVNVTKHTALQRAMIEVEVSASGMAVVVSDEGPGMAGTARQGAGLRDSVTRRAAAAGIDVRIASSPTRGTRVRLDVPWVRSVPAEDGTAAATTLADGADRILRDGAWIWCVAVAAASTAVGVIGIGTPATNGGSGLALALVALIGATARHGRQVPRPIAWLAAAGAPVVWLLLYLGANGAGGRPELWQMLGATPPLVLLLTFGAHRLPTIVGPVLVLATATATALTVGQDDVGAGVLALIGAVVCLCQLNVWQTFAGSLGRITSAAAASRADAERDQGEQVAIETTQEVQRRWRDARLHSTIDLLERIVDGSLDPRDESVQRRASTEERSLRQLLLLRPTHAHLGAWLARAIGRSRTRGVGLTVRVTDADLPDLETAQAVGRTLLTIIGRLDAGTDAVFALLPHGDEHLPSLVVPTRAIDAEAARASADVEGCDLDVRRLGQQTMLVLAPRLASSR